MKKYLLILLIMAACKSAETQPLYKIEDVDHLYLYVNSVHLLKKENDSLYSTKYLTSIDPLTVYQTSQKRSLSQLNITSTKVIPISDLFMVSVDEWIDKFMSKEYIISDGINKEGFIMTLEMISPNIWVERLYNSYDKENNRWRSHHASVFYMHFISLPNGMIYLQGTGNYYIIPYKSAFLAGMGEFGELNKLFDYRKCFPDKLTYSYNKLQNITSYSFYSIDKNKRQKYELKDKLGNNLLQQHEYDTIYTNRYFIVGQQGSKYDIYNTLLQSVCKDVDGFNFLDFYIQCIQNNRLITLNVNGGTDTSYTEMRFRCGSVPHFQLNLQKNEKGEFTIKWYLEEEFIIGDANAWDNITFINGHNEVFYDSNDLWDLVGNTIGIGYDWLMMEKNGKFGISCVVRGADGKYHLQQVLPVEYDKIEFRSHYEPVTLHKNELQQVCANIFDSQSFGNDLKLITSPLFKTIKEQQKYFLHYEKPNGEKGWYDILKDTCIVSKK